MTENLYSRENVNRIHDIHHELENLVMMIKTFRDYDTIQYAEKAAAVTYSLWLRMKRSEY